MNTVLRIALVLVGVGCVAYSIAVGMAIGPYLVALWRIVGGGL